MCFKWAFEPRIWWRASPPFCVMFMVMKIYVMAHRGWFSIMLINPAFWNYLILTTILYITILTWQIVHYSTFVFWLILCLCSTNMFLIPVWRLICAPSWLSWSSRWSVWCKDQDVNFFFQWPAISGLVGSVRRVLFCPLWEFYLAPSWYEEIPPLSPLCPLQHVQWNWPCMWILITPILCAMGLVLAWILLSVTHVSF